MTEGAFHPTRSLSPTALAVVVLMHGAAITALALAKIDSPALDRTRTKLIDIFTPKPPPEPAQAKTETPRPDTRIHVPPAPFKPLSGPVVEQTELKVVEVVPFEREEQVVLPAADPPRAEPKKIEPARARANLASYVSDADYPASAIRAEQQGTTRFRLGVAPNGRVTDCTVTSSSGSPTLDAATCRLMKSRARFTPARDSDGKPVSDTAASAIRWVLPDR
jgi:protein TonB